MDGITPVGTMYPQQNPIAALSSIYGIQGQQLGIQQQQQNLQTGAIQQKTAQAESTQKQQQSAELQAAQSVIKNGVAAGRYNNPDGSFNRGKAADDITAVAPTYGQGISNQLLSGANEVVANKRALMGLSQDQRTQVGGVVQSLAQNPNVSNSDVIKGMKDLIAQNPADENIAQLVISNMAHMPASGKSSDLQQALSTMSAGLTGQSAVAQGTNAAGQNQVVNPMTGMRSAPQLGPGTSNPSSSQVAGATTAATGAANNVVEDPATGNKYVYNQQNQRVNPIGQPGASSAPPQRVVGQAPSQAAVAGTDAQRYSQISQEGTNAQTGAQLADQVATLADQVRTGKLSKEWTDRLAILQQHDPTITARQMLTKYAAQLKTMATSGATTDASRSQIDEGMPSPESMNPDATKQAANYVGGIFRMRGARQQYADQYVKNAGSPLGMQGADDSFMRSADPTIFAYKALPPGPERQQFLVTHGLTTPDKQAEFKARMNQVQHYVGQ
jgi:hypothetical protein